MGIKLSLESIEVLDAIARKGSFAAAAESLFRVPSALTYTVRKLEEDLGVSLFNRSGHRAELTEAGAELLREGRHLLSAASELESRVRRVASGIETELCIAVSDIFNIAAMYPILDRFYAQDFGTRIKLLREVYGGGWDALLSGRADISVGAPGDAPPGVGYAARPFGKLEFHYAVAPHHPLANLPEPLQNQDIMRYRSVSAADSSRSLPPRTSGILSGQDVLTVPDMEAKLQAQISGLGVGYLPKTLAEKYAAAGKLVIKQVAEPKPEVTSFLAWRTDGGKAQQWLIKELQQMQLENVIL
ncbi:MAG: LysR family transcriptional regulator [Methylotenera sp.]